MKLSVLQENFARGLVIVARVVSPRSGTLPVLANVLLTTEQGRLRLAATDLEMGVISWVGAKIETEGALTVPARTIAELIGTLPNDRIEIATTGVEALALRCGACKTTLKGIAAGEFPPMPLPETGGNEIHVPVAGLKLAIQQTVLAASTEQARPVLTGVLLKAEGNRLTLSAADGFRLSVRHVELAASAPYPLSALVPARALNELARVLPNDGEVSIALTQTGQVVFRAADVAVLSQTISGQFPDLQMIIPKKWTTRATISTQALLKAARQAEIFAGDGGQHIARLEITPANGMPGAVKIAGAGDTGAHNARVEANIEGGDVQIAFNARFLYDVLEVVKTPNVALEIASATTPGVIRPVGDDSFLHALMPMNVSSQKQVEET